MATQAEKKREPGNIVNDINSLLKEALVERALLPVRAAKESEKNGGLYQAFNRDIVRANCEDTFNELRAKFSELEAEYVSHGIRPYKNLPTFLEKNAVSITVRTSEAYKGFYVDMDAESDSVIVLSRRVEDEDSFGGAREFYRALQAQSPKLELHYEEERLSTVTVATVTVTANSFVEYCSTLGIEHTKIRFRTNTGKQYRAKIQYSDKDSVDMRWGMLVLPHDSSISRSSIYFPRPRQARKGSLQDPLVATQLKAIGDVSLLNEGYEVFLVK
ncbi:hypothetical protein AB4525_08025 [Vibrio breoganii]|uniref:Uncharacterized protein n=1 Tax=Vibrio breoganii TaxID=553239 RepID=A0AAP8N129_9VIBR|nr:hypothetical protein [Vibrio breoganii]PMK31646.1 hypothetical protein BCU03_07215 [Vibrio breoganii]PMK78535.1 hypothetical protein BCT94_05460 [Vibrio breoganii]PMP14023.1 hypothetical protein BCS93_04335 [Vibrio breoganii]